MGDEIVTTPFGRFLVNTRDLIESTLKAGTLWDGPGFLQPIAIEYGRLGEVGTTILDVGANVGSFSVWLASRGAWRVLAVEPVPSTMQRLKANLDLNRERCADCVIPLEVAAYDVPKWLYTGPLDPGNIGGTALLPRGTTGAVSAKPLDEYLWLMGTRVSLIKLDIQGCEGAALRGLTQVIYRHSPAVVFEWDATLASRHPWTLQDTCEFLSAYGYHTTEWPTHPGNYLAVSAKERR